MTGLTLYSLLQTLGEAEGEGEQEVQEEPGWEHLTISTGCSWE